MSNQSKTPADKQDSYNQFLADLKRSSETPPDAPAPSKKKDAPVIPEKTEPSKLEQILTGKAKPQQNTSSVGEKTGNDDRCNKMSAKLSAHFEWVATWAFALMVIEIVALSLWTIAYFWAQSLDVRAVAQMLAGDDAMSHLYVFVTSTSLSSVVLSIGFAVVCYFVYRHYKKLSESI